MQRTRRMRLSITSPPPWLPLKKKNLKYLPCEKKNNPSSSFPLPRHPLPPHFHHSPSPCSRILLYKPGTDVCRGRAERPRCSGCQPHAFHSEMKAHSSPSCEANFKKRERARERERGGKKQTLQMPSSPFKRSTYMSASFCLLSASATSVTGSFFLSVCVICKRGGRGKVTRCCWQEYFLKGAFKCSSAACSHAQVQTEKEMTSVWNLWLCTEK